MPFSLHFTIESRGGVMVLIDHRNGAARPATTIETELWNALTKRVAPARESYIRVNEQDMMNLLIERDKLKQQVSILQDRLEQDGEKESRSDIPAESERDSAGGEPPADGEDPSTRGDGSTTP